MWVSGPSSASAPGPCTASSAVASEMSRSRTLAPRFCATMCAQSAAMLAAFTTSLGLSWFERPNVVARYSLHERVPVRAADLELTHVRDIEHTHALAHGAVLGRDSRRIAHRHVVAAVRHHFRAERDVNLVQRGALGSCVGHFTLDP